jgi:hypothetical protein
LSIDVIERRRAVEERLRRARNLAASLENATADLITDSGRTMDDLDPDGSLRTAVASLAGVAALRPGFDVLVSLPNSTFALRIRHMPNDVDVSLVPHELTVSDDLPANPPVAGLPEPRELSDPIHSTEPGGHVVSDLAAMLWQDVGPPPP